MPRFEQQRLYIDGRYVEATSASTFESMNPATGEVLAELQCASQADVDKAVASAAAGQKVWAALTAMQRSRILRRAVDILRERNDELAELETLDTGKPLTETRTVDIVTGADVLEYYAGLVPASHLPRCRWAVTSNPAWAVKTVSQRSPTTPGQNRSRSNWGISLRCSEHTLSITCFRNSAGCHMHLSP